MSDIEVFEIDDRFDPLAEMPFGDDEVGQESDYLPPIPDAELSRVPKVAPLTVRERIEALLTGIPGQKFRILYAVELCVEPRTCEEVAAALDERFAGDVSVYDSAQIVRLLERAGALELCEPADSATPSASTPADTPTGYRVVSPPPKPLYRATAEGLEVVAENTGSQPILELFSEEQRYLPLFHRILELVSAEGGCTAKELDAAIDPDPLCENPRRFCGYFLGRLEDAGALRWQGAWMPTEQGREILASYPFTNERKR